jgi:ABC-type nitrate/sulfonate/bicarbonate transport system ATPase subunit
VIGNIEGRSAHEVRRDGKINVSGSTAGVAPGPAGGTSEAHAVSVKDVYFAYGNSLILKDISFDVDRGQFVSIIGPSGCGKSTLLRTIQGLLPPNSGSITVEGVPVSGPSGNRAMVFQHFALLPWKSVLSNVALGIKYQRKVDASTRTELAQKFLRMVGLEGFEHLYPHQLSGGMQQRVGIARAFAVEAAVLLLDEPFGALDAQNAEIMREELTRLVRQERSTAIMVTHNLDEALGLTDRVLVMGANPGTVLEDVQVDQVRATVSDPTRWATSVEYSELRERLWETLRDEVMRAQAREKVGGGA